jgi:hypothetical protein
VADVSPEETNRRPDAARAEGEEAVHGDPLAGLRDCHCTSLDRSAIRTRESLVTRSGWRLTATCAEGEGTISLIELSPTVSLFRGEGVFLGWSSERLQAAYRTLLPRTEDTSESDFPQLG